MKDSGLASTLIVLFGIRKEPYYSLFAHLYLLIFMLLIPLIFNRAFLNIPTKNFGINKNKTLKNIILGIILSLLSMVPFYILAGKDITINYWRSNIGIYLIVHYLLIAIGEEFFFRGFLINILSMKFGKVITIILSSLIFVFVHSNPISGFIYLFFCGISYALLFILTGSLIAPMILHFSQNLFLGDFVGVLAKLGYENIMNYVDISIAMVLLIPFFIKIYKDKTYLQFEREIKSYLSQKKIYKFSFSLITIYILFTFVLNPNILVKTINKDNEFETYIIAYKGAYKKDFSIDGGNKMVIGIDGGNFKHLEVINLKTKEKVIEIKRPYEENVRITSERTIEEEFEKGKYQVKFKTNSANREAKIYIKVSK